MRCSLQHCYYSTEEGGVTAAASTQLIYIYIHLQDVHSFTYQPRFSLCSLYYMKLSELKERRGNMDNLGINYPWFCIKTYVVTHNSNSLTETVLMRVTIFVFVDKRN